MFLVCIYIHNYWLYTQSCLYWNPLHIAPLPLMWSYGMISLRLFEWCSHQRIGPTLCSSLAEPLNWLHQVTGVRAEEHAAVYKTGQENVTDIVNVLGRV